MRKKHSKVRDHVHKFQRIELGTTRVVRKDGKRYLEKQPGYEVFKCMVPDCPTFMPRVIVIGKQSVCWACGDAMILNMENTSLKKPTHIWCRKTRVRMPGLDSSQEEKSA